MGSTVSWLLSNDELTIHVLVLFIVLVLELPLVPDGGILRGVRSVVIRWVFSWIWWCCGVRAGGEVRPKAERKYHVEVVLGVPVRLRLLRAILTVLPNVDELL